MNKKQTKLSSAWTRRFNDDSDEDVICLSSSIAPKDKMVKPKKTKSVGITHSQVPSSSSKNKNCNTWVTSSFDDFLDVDMSQSQPVSGTTSNKDVMKSRGLKRSRDGVSPFEKSTTFSRSRLAKDLLWADKHTPNLQSELAVHKKKIKEVEEWLQRTLKKNSNQNAPILLLTGPTGAGKTATIHVLAKELGMEVQEWSNPVVTYLSKEEYQRSWSEFSQVEGYRSQSQAQIFEDFLLRANKYPTLQIFGEDSFERKVILVEDYPNAFFKDSTAFHSILRKYIKTGRSPLVFIISESAGGESNEKLLFPKELQADLQVTNISYNPVAPTMMTKILSRVANQESLYGAKSFPVPDRSTIEALAAASNGDIRGAINTLQFACLKDTRDLQKTFSKKSRTTQSRKSKSSSSKSISDTSDNSLTAIGGKDTSLFLFRALGKILYCKREEPGSNVDIPHLPDHLAEHTRNPLAFNPEDVVERCHLSSDMFNAYLHQNYLDFSTSVEGVTRASDYLSLADSVTADWAVRSVMNEYSSSLATRGLLHSHSGRPPGGAGWKPLHKPQWFSVMRQMREKIATAKGLFRGYHWTPDVLQTELIPYLGLINVTMHDPTQITFLHDITKFKRHNHSALVPSDRLDEKDISGHLADDDVTMPGNKTESAAGEISSSQSNKSQVEEEDDIEIEDYDSD